ncbi:MAG: ATP-binding cassette domain-containing protein [Planctomycetales bacterium]|nr:ATP-binding cassette domain-containing protein [Planctomycetales bacterium]
MIVVRDLWKSFQADGRQVDAVRGVSFHVEPGEVYGLLGPNGAGKTTTLRMILGLLDPDTGYTEVDGYRTIESAREVKARIGFVSAGAGLYPWHTVREMLLYFADIYGVSDADAQRQLSNLIDVLDLGDFVDRRGVSLSTGQRQRVVLALGLIHDPPVMMLDEPTRGLDVVGSDVVFQYIGQLRELGKAVVICTHRLEQAERICDRFGLMHQGQLAYEGTLADLRQQIGQETLVDMFLGILRTQREASQ